MSVKRCVTQLAISSARKRRERCGARLRYLLGSQNVAVVDDAIASLGIHGRLAAHEREKGRRRRAQAQDVLGRDTLVSI